MADPASWPYPPDVMYADAWPVAQPALLFGALAYGRDDWVATWAPGEHDPQVFEVLRNTPVRNPLLWV